MDSILRIIPRLRAHDPLSGDHRGTFGDDRSSDLSGERRLSEQLRPRLPGPLRRPCGLQRHPHRSRPRQPAEHPAGRHPAPRAGTDRFHGQLGHRRRAGNRFLQTKPVACVISDISVIGILVGERLGVRNIGIANFSWCEQYEFLGLSEILIARFREVYAKLDLLIEYDLMLPTHDLDVPRKQIGFIARKFNPDRIAAIKSKYGPSIFITCGKSADLDNIQVDNYTGTIFATSGINITSTANIVQLPVETFDTHNYLAASDIIIAKAGWGTISEALLSKRNLVLIEREGVLEDTENIEELKRRGVAVSIKETDLARIDMQAINDLIAENIVRENLDAYENAVEAVVQILTYNSYS